MPRPIRNTFGVAVAAMILFGFSGVASSQYAQAVSKAVRMATDIAQKGISFATKIESALDNKPDERKQQLERLLYSENPMTIRTAVEALDSALANFKTGPYDLSTTELAGTSGIAPPERRLDDFKTRQECQAYLRFAEAYRRRLESDSSMSVENQSKLSIAQSAIESDAELVLQAQEAYDALANANIAWTNWYARVMEDEPYFLGQKMMEPYSEMIVEVDDTLGSIFDRIERLKTELRTAIEDYDQTLAGEQELSQITDVNSATAPGDNLAPMDCYNLPSDEQVESPHEARMRRAGEGQSRARDHALARAEAEKARQARKAETRRSTQQLQQQTIQMMNSLIARQNQINQKWRSNMEARTRSKASQQRQAAQQRTQPNQAPPQSAGEDTRNIESFGDGGFGWMSEKAAEMKRDAGH